jgi:hypothetical protein
MSETVNKTVEITIWRGCATVDYVPEGVAVQIKDEDTGETETWLPTATLKEVREEAEQSK